MSAECCFASHEPPHFLPDQPCHRPLDFDEPCRMATGANYDEDKMAAADETTRALDYIREMCLDRPCPNCKGEVVDKPQDDLRQCRGCGHLWGFDDTQNLEEFVREYARMEPCVTCGNDSLDEFEVLDNHGRQELICQNCQSVQGTARAGMDRIGEDYEVVEGGYGNPEHDPNPRRRERDLACPFCPDMTSDFFEKQYDREVLVRAVCPSCSYVVFFRGQDDDIDDGIAMENGVGWEQEDDRSAKGNGDGWAHEGDKRAMGSGVGWAQEDRRANGNGARWTQEDGVQERRAPESGINCRPRVPDLRRELEQQLEDEGGKAKSRLFPQVRRAMRYLCVKPIDLAQHALQECADSIIEKDDRLAPRMRAMAAREGPIMAEQLGWTIGTAVGNVMFRTPGGAALTGNVGSIVGRGVCNMVLQSLPNRRHLDA